MVSAGIFQISPEEHAANPRVVHEYDGMIKRRKTTDVLFLILIGLMWAAMTYVGYTGLRSGDPYRVLGPIDYQGNVCGYEASQSSNPFLYTVTTSGLGVCVSSCPNLDASLSSTSPSDYVCFDQVPPTSSSFASYIKANCFYGGLFAINATSCLCNIKRATTNILRRCIFDDATVRSYYINQNVPSYFTSFITDVYTAKIVIFGFGFGVTIVLSYLYSHLLAIKGLGSFLAWSGLIGTCLAMGAFAYYAEETSITWSNENPQVHSSEETLALKLFGYILAGIAGLFFCMVIFLRRQINLSVKVLTLTSTCINDMKAIVLTPLINVIAFGIFLAPCFIYFLYVASDGNFETVYIGGVAVGKTYHFASGVIERLWFLFFCLLWTLSWITSMSAIAISIACAKWYFTLNQNISQINSCTVILAYGLTIRFHWGTAAFGSLIISIVEFIRWFLLYLQKQYNGMPCRGIVKYVCCCIQCCLWCLEKFLKFVSKNAYIQTAIHVHHFPPLNSLEID